MDMLALADLAAWHRAIAARDYDRVNAIMAPRMNNPYDIMFSLFVTCGA